MLYTPRGNGLAPTDCSNAYQHTVNKKAVLKEVVNCACQRTRRLWRKVMAREQLTCYIPDERRGDPDDRLIQEGSRVGAGIGLPWVVAETE